MTPNARRILLVDDDEAILKLVQITLGSKDREILNSTTGEEALQLLETKKVDLVVLDCQLPGMSGIEVATALRKKPAAASIPIIMLTGSGDSSRPSEELGVFAYITKPFSPRELMQKVNQALQRKTGSGA